MEDQQDSQFLENPFVKSRNRDWSIAAPASLNAPVSPPRKRRRQSSTTKSTLAVNAKSKERHISAAKSISPGLAAIEAGKAQVDDHFGIFSSRLLAAARPLLPSVPRLPHADWLNLYLRNQHPHGRHFVIHQHDHPIAGPHYDLRLQFSEPSSLSFAIMYGLPGNPNSRRLNRNATETRVHNLWNHSILTVQNHLVESASASTGSLIIWDTGEYSVLPYYKPKKQVETDDSCSDSSGSSAHDEAEGISESDKLKKAFGQRKIRLRLHGTRLPPDYTISLRLTMENYASTQPKKPSRRRRRRHTTTRPERTSSTSRSPSRSPIRGSEVTPTLDDNIDSPSSRTAADQNFANHSDEEDEQVRVNNAYPGAINSISSIHQRRWFLSLDRVNSGFERRFDSASGRYSWCRRSLENDTNGSVRGLLGFEPFYVRGPEVERSVVTGRLGSDILKDEGVDKFVGRKGWRPVLV